MKHLKKLPQLTMAVTLMLTMAAQAQTPYKLEQTNHLSHGHLYVMEQDGYVMTNSISNKALQTTNNYLTEELSGTEPYVWQLEGDDDTQTYKLANANRSTSSYLTNVSSKADLEWNSSSKATKWTFTLQDDGQTFIIKNVLNEATDYWRFLGFVSQTNHSYKAYVHQDGYDHTTPYSITIYELIDTSTGITSIQDASAATEQQPCYNLAGQSVSRPSKGIYIKGHRKVNCK